MLKVLLRKGPDTKLSTLVVFAAKDKKSGKAQFPKLSASLQELANDAVENAHFSGGRKEAVFYRRANADGYAAVAFVGLGTTGDLGLESARLAAAHAFTTLKSHHMPSAGIWLASLTKHFRDPAGAVQALAEGFLLSPYDFVELKSKKDDKDKKPELHEVALLTEGAPAATLQKALGRAVVLAECQNFVRHIGDMPGNYMTPSILAEETVKAAKGTGLKVTVWDESRIKKERFGGLLYVAKGSAEPPRFIVMEYNGAGKGKKPLCFVGKGLTFDTGGISIKPSASMEEMKYDMMGGAAVIGAMLALAKLKAKVNVIAYVPSTENMPGPTASKPGDVYIARNGKSVEVHNTDAEGRLILGDALAYASEQKPAVILDAATLTGAILVALGNTHTGVFTRDKKLMAKIEDAAERTGELVWHMPIHDFHVEDMKGAHADLCNISGGRNAGSCTAAAFLEQFVDRDIPFAHFDIAGTAWNVHSRFPYCPRKGASGVMVRTFVEIAETF